MKVALQLAAFLLLSFSIPLSSGQSFSTAKDDGSSQRSKVQDYEKTRSTLLDRTAVPVRLPTYIPPYADEENPIFAIVDSASSHEYRVQLAWAKNCEGGNSCHLGEITGTTDPLTARGSKTPVALGFGITGYFVQASVGSYCSDAKVLWSEGAYHYSIAMKCEKKSILVRMARSAIISGKERH
jgi:hypothetical protein